MKRFKYIIAAFAALALVAVLAYAGTVHKLPYGVATPKWYGYSSGVKSTYYLEHPILTGDDQVVVEGVAQTLTNKTITNILDASGNISYATGTTIPTATTAGYSIGGEFVLTSALLGQSPKWINQGSATSCLFVPIGPVMGYGIAVAGGPIDCTNGSTTLAVAQGLIRTADFVLAGHEVSDDDDQIVSVLKTAGKDTMTITVSADPLDGHDYVYASLRNKSTPEYDIVAAGTHTTAGGNVAEAITVAGVLAGDIAFANYGATDDTDTISDVVCAANTVTVTMSADPSTGHSLHYVVLRQRGTFAPSHYVAYAGSHTTAGGDATETKTVTGVATTDVVITVFNTTDDTDNILKTVLTTNTVTWTLSTDPSTAHALTYAILRAY